MAKNFVQPGKTVTQIAPAGGLVSGQPFIVGKLVGVALSDALAGEQVEMGIEGVYNLPTGAACAAGDLVYFDAAAGNFVKVATGNTKAGIALKAAGAAANVDIKLSPGIG